MGALWHDSRLRGPDFIRFSLSLEAMGIKLAPGTAKEFGWLIPGCFRF